MQVPRHLIAVLISVALLSACFVNNLIYNHADWIVQYQIDRYFDLDQAQEQAVEIAIKESVQWFKQERMTAVLDLLDAELKAARGRRLDVDSTERWFNLLHEIRRAIITRLLPVIVQVGINLNSDQIAHFSKMMDRGNKNLRQAAHADEADFEGDLAGFAESTFDRFEYLIGDLSKEQREIIVREMVWTKSGLVAELKVRERSRDFWVEVLQKHDQASLELAIKRANQLENSEPTESFIFYQQRSKNWMAVRAALVPTMSEKQWLHLEKKLTELSQELQRLSRMGSNRQQ